MAGQFNIVFLCHGALPTAIWIIVIIGIFKPQLEHWSCNYIYRPISDSVRDQFDSIPLLLRQKVNTPERVYLCRPCLVRCVCDTSTLCLFTWSSLTQPKSRPILLKKKIVFWGLEILDSFQIFCDKSSRWITKVSGWRALWASWWRVF